MIEFLVDVAGVDWVYHAGEQVEFSFQQERNWIAAGYAKPVETIQPDVNVTINIGGNTEVEIVE